MPARAGKALYMYDSWNYISRNDNVGSFDWLWGLVVCSLERGFAGFIGCMDVRTPSAVILPATKRSRGYFSHRLIIQVRRQVSVVNYGEWSPTWLASSSLSEGEIAVLERKRLGDAASFVYARLSLLPSLVLTLLPPRLHLLLLITTPCFRSLVIQTMKRSRYDRLAPIPWLIKFFFFMHEK